MLNHRQIALATLFFLEMKPGKKEIRGQGQEKMVRMKRIQALCAYVLSFATCAGVDEKGTIDTLLPPFYSI